ncbi:MAG: AsmA family protein, partial [Hyphomicrobiaceae bacterium]
MNNLLLWLSGVLILVLGALFVGPHFVDWNSYRSVFEAQATRLVGRDVRVEGGVNLRLLPAPYVSFE